jgi:hypothetical protein
LAGLILAACAPTDTPPTPTKTPEPAATPDAIFPPVETLADVTLGQDDLGASYDFDPANTGPMTAVLLAEGSSAETGAFLLGLDNVYGYQSAYLRTTNVDELAAIRSWVVVFENADLAGRFVVLHPTITQSEQGFEMLPFPALGDESVAFFATNPEAGVVSLDRHDVVIRRRNVAAVVIAVTAAGLADLEAIEGYARVLDARLNNLGSSQ